MNELMDNNVEMIEFLNEEITEAYGKGDVKRYMILTRILERSEGETK